MEIKLFLNSLQNTKLIPTHWHQSMLYFSLTLTSWHSLYKFINNIKVKTSSELHQPFINVVVVVVKYSLTKIPKADTNSYLHHLIKVQLQVRIVCYVLKRPVVYYDLWTTWHFLALIDNCRKFLSLRERRNPLFEGTVLFHCCETNLTPNSFFYFLLFFSLFIFI